MKYFIIASMLVLPILGDITGRVNVVQDTLGNYNLHYNTGESSRMETRSDDGDVEGSYSFIDTDGKKHTVHYTAGAHQGFHAEGDSIPQNVAETKDQIQARAQHLTIHKEIAPHTVVYKNIVEPSYSPFHVAYLLDGHTFNPIASAYKTVKVLPYQEFVSHLTLPKIETLPAGFVPEVDASHFAIKKEHLIAYAEQLERLAAAYKNKL